MKYIVINSTTGEVLRYGTCPDNLILLQAQEGETVLERPDFLEYPNEWVYINNEWQVRVPTLEEKSLAMLEHIKLLRTRKESLGVSTPYGIVDTSADSQRKISGLVQMASLLGEAFSIEFTLADNTDVLLNAEEMTTVGILVGKYISSCHTMKRNAEAAILAASTIEELEALDLESFFITEDESSSQGE